MLIDGKREVLPQGGFFGSFPVPKCVLLLQGGSQGPQITQMFLENH